MNTALSIGVAAFFYAAFYQPLSGRYSAWKADPARERVYRPNVFGQWVPDLWLTRAERSAACAIGALIIIGLLIDFTIMNQPPPAQRASDAPIVTSRPVSNPKP